MIKLGNCSSKMSQFERPRWKERRPRTFSLKSYPWFRELLGTEKIVFPRGGGPEDKKAQMLRGLLSQYWLDGGFVFISRIRELKGIDWKENEFQLKLGQLGEILEIHYGDLWKTRQALLVGELLEKEETGEKGVWAFTREELLQLIVGAHAYRFTLRKHRRRKKR